MEENWVYSQDDFVENTDFSKIFSAYIEFKYLEDEITQKKERSFNHLYEKTNQVSNDNSFNEIKKKDKKEKKKKGLIIKKKVTFKEQNLETYQTNNLNLNLS